MHCASSCLFPILYEIVEDAGIARRLYGFCPQAVSRYQRAQKSSDIISTSA